MLIRTLNLLIIIVLSFQYSKSQYYQLVWSDEFNGTELDVNNWNYDIGNGCPNLCGWGNNESQYYREENVSFTDGKLVITANEESHAGYNYTSAKIHTRNKATFTYGKFEARIKLPKGKGIWPAFWLLYNDPTYGIWPHSGEIDIMELLGHDPDRVYGTVHYGGGHEGHNFVLPNEDFSEDFHTFSVIWDSIRVRWYVDDILYGGITKFALDQNHPWPFDHPFYIILNVAVGGNWPGYPDANTSFPQTMEVDYVRVYEETSEPSKVVVPIDDQISLYPNPTTGNKLYLDFEEAKARNVYISDIYGKIIYEAQISQNHYIIDLSHYAAGSYILNTKSNSSESSIKFTIAK